MRGAVRRALGCALGVMMLAACGAKAPPPRPGGPEILQGGVVFRYRNTDAERVNLVGDFNAWDPTADPMADENEDGEWTLFYPLAPGRYAYKFVIDDRRWIADPTNPESEPDGFDGRNSIVVVPGVEP
jgi:1,4-alpha-glucan branching enzyme